MKEAKNVQDDIRMDVSFFTLQSTSSEEELFNPNLPSLMKENVEVLKPQQLFDDLKKLSNNNIDGEDKKHVDSSSDSDSSDSSDSESTKSGNGDHLSSSDSSISSDSDSSKETEDKVMKDLTQEESAQERNIFSTMQQTASPPKPSPGKNVVTTYSIKPPSSVDNQIQSLQANVRIVPKITIRLPQLSPKRDERKRSRDEESERPNKETGRHSSPQRSVTGQDKAFDKFVFSETDKKQVMDGPPRDTLRLLKTDEKGGQPIKNSVTSSNPVSCVNDASEIRTLLLKPRETGRTREIASPAASTGSEVTTNNRRRYNKNNDHELATVTSSQNSSARTVSCLGVTGKMTTRSSSALEGIITRSSSGRNSPKVSIDSSTHSNKSDKAEKASSKESSPARSDKSQTGNINFEISQTNSGKSSPKTMPESASSGSERSSPKRVSDSFVPTVGKLTIKVGVAENIIQSSNQAGKSSPKTNNGVSTGVSKTDELSEKPVRVTRTLRSNSHAHAHAQAQANSGSENSNQEKEKETINVPLTRSRRNQVEATTTTPSEPAPPPPVVESHPRKRKMARHREQNNDESVLEPPVRLAPEQRTNSFEMFLNIRQIVAERHKSLCPVTSKAPQGFKQYLTFRKNYVLDNSDHSKRKAVPQ
ncbi:uncharacterized protein LOC102804234, partial [Saccoglossus kowalevskii]|uniref:Dentin sialophosphoprotein-like n=1 Tax=Saccoglossus kowalevskii TaxID=10224 RepID=A0ABM0MVQ0_SACKO